MVKKKHKAKLKSTELTDWLGSIICKLIKIEPNYVDLDKLSKNVKANQHSKKRFGEIKRFSYKPVTVSFGALVVVALLWVGASLSFSHFSVAGLTLSTKLSYQNVLNDATNQAMGYRLKISYPDETIKNYRLAQVGLSVDDQATINQIKSSDSLVKKLTWWKPIPINIKFKTDSTQLNNFVASDTQIVVEPSQDANLSLSGGEIKISNSVTGKEYGLADSTNTIYETASTLSTSPIKLKTLVVNPAITSAQLTPYKSQITNIIDKPVSFSVGGQTIKPTTSDIANWLDISNDDKTKKVDIQVNSGKVLAYLDSISASQTKPPKAEIDVTNTDGSTQVLVPGASGQVVSGENTIATTVANNLASGKGINDQLTVAYKPYETITAGDYPKWIEVDITNKVLYAYENANLVQTYLVTAGAPKTPTVTGQYKIYKKYLVQNMRGENVDGSNYYQPDVQWVNYFYSDYAIHGNYWRPLSYFGHVNSSHGCVGLVNSEAEWIYNWAPVGTPVIVHA
jgi:lipoprotein-anchoring transpeptidase ErfK/SrfK